jgi:hypothetical protein
MQSRLTLTLNTADRNALRILARKECREIHQQAVVIIRDELVRRGLLVSEVPPSLLPVITTSATAPKNKQEK